MARTPATLPEGVRITDRISLGVIAKTFPRETVDEVLEEIGVDTSQHVSKPLSKYLGNTHFSYLITVCGNAEERCPMFPGMGMRMHWPFEDPAAFQGSDDAKTEKFREIRDQIEARILAWLAEYPQ